MSELPIIAKLHEQVGTGHFYDDGYASVGAGKVESRPATEAKRSANRDGAEAAAIIGELYDALDEALDALVMASCENVGTDEQKEAQRRLVRAESALAKARGEQAHSEGRMTDPIASAMDSYLVRSIEALGLPAVVPEPEVVRSTLSRVRCKSLASCIAAFLDSEPLRSIERDGASVCVTDHDGNVMRFVITEGE